MAQVTVPHFINDPVHWHRRAVEIRVLAELMNDEATKQRMLRVAQDRLAVRASIRIGDARLGSAKTPIPKTAMKRLSVTQITQ